MVESCGAKLESATLLSRSSNSCFHGSAVVDAARKLERDPKIEHRYWLANLLLASYDGGVKRSRPKDVHGERRSCCRRRLIRGVHHTSEGRRARTAACSIHYSDHHSRPGPSTTNSSSVLLAAPHTQYSEKSLINRDRCFRNRCESCSRCRLVRSRPGAEATTRDQATHSLPLPTPPFLGQRAAAVNRPAAAHATSSRRLPQKEPTRPWTTPRPP